MKVSSILSTDALIADIDKCIGDIVGARLSHDTKAEGRALFKMEGLMVASMQQLSALRDILAKEDEP